MKNKLLLGLLMLVIWIIGQETYDKLFHPAMWDMMSPEEIDKSHLEK